MPGVVERLVIDTSVAAKWFLREPLSERAVAILEAARSGAVSLLAPDLIYPEFASAVRKHVRRGPLAPEDGAIIVAAFAQIPFEAVFPSRPLAAAAYRIAQQYGCTVYAAVFIAAASQAAADLVTADEKLYRSVGSGISSVRWLGDN